MTAILPSARAPPVIGFGPTAPERFSIVRISLATGGVTATLFPGIDPLSNSSALAVDNTGRYVMFTHVDVFLRAGNTSYAAGWIDARHFRKLPLNPGGGGVAW